jgi:hypothetical protein
MTLLPEEKEEPEIIRISLRWIIVGATVVVLLGILGGLIAVLAWPPVVSPLAPVYNPAMPLVQEIKILPNEAKDKIIQRADRSIIILGKMDGESVIPHAAGAVVTSDGIVAAPTSRLTGATVAIDFAGQIWPLEKVGDDAVYGLSYFHLKQGVSSPSDLSSGELPVGWELLLLSRNPESFQLKARSAEVQDYVLPRQEAPPGQQRLLSLGEQFEAGWEGGLLIDSEGRLSGIMLKPEEGLALTISDIRDSLERLTQGKREFNPLDNLGFRISKSFRRQDEQTLSFAVRVSQVLPRTPAALGGVQTGDVIKEINKKEVQWETNVIKLLTRDLPITLTVERAGAIHELTLR